jgi:glycosyltransferase involved in cell wall biosynthesis
VEKGPRRPRIGFDARALAFPAGGVRRYVREIFSLLPALEPSIDFIAVDPPPGIELPPGTKSGPYCPGLPTNLARAAIALPLAVRRARLDLFHAPAYTAPLRGHTPVVLTVHDVSYARVPEFYAHRAGRVRQWFYRRSATRAARVITDSEFSRREIAAAYALPESEMAVIPLGVGAPFAPASADPAAILPSGIAPPYVLHVGDLHPRRDLITALRAVIAVRARAARRSGAGRGGPASEELGGVQGPPPSEIAGSSLRLVCAGTDRGSAAALRRFGAEAAAPDALVLPGPVSEGDLVRLYQQAVALVYPSLYEGFGLPVLEAMACGLPVVAARAGSVPEVLGDAGILVDGGDWLGVADALAVLLAGPERRAALRDRGLARAADFSWERTARRTLDVYRACLREAGSGSLAGVS